MVFVNEIAEVVHGLVDAYSGSPNKNIGDAFLLVWKFEEEDYYPDHAGELHLNVNTRVEQIADMACLSFLKIIVKINRSFELAKVLI